MYTTEAGSRLVVAGIAPGGPADRAGIKVGDMVLEVAGEKPSDLADLWRRVWRLGPAGCGVSLKLLRKNHIKDALLQSADRGDFLKKPHLH
jgi:S1-C subfamily serine protease